jgi:alcohol dehydrogenase class IV
LLLPFFFFLATSDGFFFPPTTKTTTTAMMLRLTIPKRLAAEAQQALLVPPGMDGGVHVGVPFGPTALSQIEQLAVSKVYVMANKSSKPMVENFLTTLEEKGLLAAPINCDVSMGGAEDGLLKACNEAAAVKADCVVTIGGGAVQDAGKLVRLWLSAAADNVDGEEEKATVKGIQAASNRDPMPPLPPQICCPNSFAMAELTHVAGLVTKDNVKSGAAHPSIMPTVVIFDTTLSKGLPDWVRFGTALRGVEHAIGAVCHPKATEDIRSRALQGLDLVNKGLKGMVENPDSEEAQVDCYLGGWMAIRALNTGCYSSIAHLIQNHYSARFNVHQGSCSGILSARILHYHREESSVYQKSISKVLLDNGDGEEQSDLPPASKLLSDLVATLPGVAKDHADAKVDEEMLRVFAEDMYNQHGARLNSLCPKPFGSAEDILGMFTLPIEKL